MTKSNTARAAATAALVVLAQVAQASDAGPEGMGEMSVSGSTLAMIVGGLAVMGVAMWLLIKFISK